MKHSEYSVEASSSLLSFEFNSEGPKGTIKKQVSFHAFSDAPNVYNLSLADIDKSGQVNDMIASNNNDHQKILSTVALTISRFFEKHPNSYVFVMGNTPSRTRLYRMAICNNLERVRDDYHVFGLAEENVWELFEKDQHYESFLITRKNNNFEYEEVEIDI